MDGEATLVFPTFYWSTFAKSDGYNRQNAIGSMNVYYSERLFTLYTNL